MYAFVKAKHLWLWGLGGAVIAFVPACKERSEVVREELSEKGYEMTQEAFFRAAESDDLAALTKLIVGGMPVETRDTTGRTALHAAAGSGALKSVDFLLEQGMAVDATDDKGRTPLMEAVVRSTPETVRYLLRQGADPSLKDQDQYKPLMLAVKEGRQSMVPELAAYVREDLDDALLAAAILGQAKVIDSLTNFGASVYARVPDGRTALMLAAQKGNEDTVDMLLAIGANRFAMDSEGRMAADFAQLGGFEELATRLAEEPREGDFELEEPAELGLEMVQRLDEADPLSPAGSREDPGTELAGNDPLESGETDDGAAAGPTGASLDDPASAAAGTGRSQPIAGRQPLVSSAIRKAARSRPPEPLEGAILGNPTTSAAQAAAAADPDAPAGPPSEPLVMRLFQQKVLPLRIESVEEDHAVVRLAGGPPEEVKVGSTIPGSSLKVIRVERKMRSGKDDQGAPIEVSVVEVSDETNGKQRELVAGLQAHAHDPVALVEDAETGRFFVARVGQRFRSADGTDYLVADVRPNQIVIEDEKSRQTTTIRLRGPRG